MVGEFRSKAGNRRPLVCGVALLLCVSRPQPPGPTSGAGTPGYEHFADLGIKDASPSFVDSKIKMAGQEEVEMKAISSHLSGVSVPTIAPDCQRFS
jgi:hypothetical protein